MRPPRLSYTDVLGTKTFLAQTETQSQPSTSKETGDKTGSKGAPGSPFGNLLFPLAIAFVIIFMMILPQRRKDKRRRQMLADLNKGDRVVTIGGIHGEISQISDRTAILTVDGQQGTTLKMARSAVSRILTDEDEEEADA